MTIPDNFEVALSFPGEKREFVSAVAALLFTTLGKEKVFYDNYYEAELAVVNLDTLLQNIYHDRTKLNVVFLCQEYDRKPWCGIEWRSLRDLIKQGRGDAIMFIRFDDATISGLFSIDGYVSAKDNPPKRIAELILQRLGNLPDQQPIAGLPPESLPAAPKCQVSRDALIDSIVAQCEDNELLVVKGPSSVGKTTLLAQLYRSHAARSVAVFLKRSSPSTYDVPSIRTDIVAQIQRICHVNKPTGYRLRQADTSDLSSALSNLRKISAATDLSVLFIIDGLDDIPSSDEPLAKAIFELFPLGYTHFTVVTSGKRALQFLNQAKQHTRGEFVVPAFTEHESSLYLQDLYRNPEDRSHLHRLGKGIPGYFAAVRRLATIDSTLPSDLPATLEKLLDLEWKQMEGDSFREQLIAFLCYDKRRHDFISLAGLINAQPEQVASALQPLSFIQEDAGKLIFASDDFRTLAEERLSHLKRQTLHRLIEFFLSEPRSDDSSEHLTDLFNRAERYDDLVNHIDQIFSIHSQRPDAVPLLHARSSLALKAALARNRNEDALKFGLYRSNLNQLYLDSYWASRLDALMSVGAHAVALRTARAAPSGEDRVQSLSAIARYQKTTHGKIEPDLLAELLNEYSRLNREQLGRRAYDIASDLVVASPALAIELVQYATDRSSSTSETDFQVTRFSLGAQLTKSGDAPLDAIDSLSKRISNPELRGIAHAVSRVSGTQSPSDIINEVSAMASDKERQFFLRVWSTENKTHPGRGIVVNHALQTAIKSTDVAPTPGFYVDVLSGAEGLPEIRDIIATVDGQLPTLEVQGPTMDVKRLQLRLAELEATIDAKKGQRRFNIVVASFSAIDDLSIQASALAKAIALVTRLRNTSIGVLFEPRMDALYRELRLCVSSTLEKTADHYQVLKHCFEELSPVDFVTACELAEQLNTESRRDEAFCDIIYNSVVRRERACDIALLTPWFIKISSAEVRNSTVNRILKALARGKRRKHELYHVADFESWIASVRTTEDQAIAYAYLSNVVGIYDQHKQRKDIERLLAHADHLIFSTPSSIEKVGALYALTFALSDFDRARAASYLTHAEKLRSKMIIRTAASENCLYLNLKLTLRAFSGLIAQKAFREIDYKELILMFGNIPGLMERLDLLSDLAIRFHLGGCSTECSIVVKEHLNPLLAAPTVSDVFREELFVLSAPALYCSTQLGCLSQLDALNEASREAAITSIIVFLFTRRVPGEPYTKVKDFAWMLDSDRVREVLSLMEELSHDGTICYACEHIVHFFDSQEGQKVSRSDREDVARRISELVAKKLPNPRFIKHEGYKILGEAYVAVLRHSKGPVWDALIERADKLPNLSDRVLVIATLAKLSGGRAPSECRRMLDEVVQLCQKIPVAYDRRDRLVMIADLAETIDKSIAKKVLRTVLGEFKGDSEDDRLEDIRRRAVDLAYQHDPKYADELVGAFDSDPAKKSAVSDRIKKHVAGLKRQTEVETDKVIENADKMEFHELVRAYWRALRKLNSGKIQPSSLKTIGAALKHMDDRALGDCYPIASFTIECLVVKYKQRPEAFSALKQVYDTCVNASKLILDYVTKIRIDTYIDIAEVKEEECRQANLSPGDSASLKRIIGQWLAEVTPKHVIIVDTSFSERELQFVELMRHSIPSGSVTVLTSRAHCDSVYPGKDVKKVFREKWKQGTRVSMVPVYMCIAGNASSGELPFNETAFVAEESALSFTASLSLVEMNGAEIRRLSGEPAAELRKRVEALAIRMNDEVDGAAIDYIRFAL